MNAYTEDLDQRNARYLAGKKAPRFVLRQPGAAIDTRLPRFESPDATLAIVCHHHQVYVDRE